METTCQRKSVGIFNERFVASSQNGSAIASGRISMAHGRHADWFEPTAHENERLALLETTAAIFAHEVANPLSGISIGLEIVQKSLESGEFDVRPLIASLQGTILEIDRLASLLNEFRDIARPQITDFQKIDLVKNTREVLSCQHEAYRKLGITVELQFQNPLPPVVANADKIKQVVLNLCNNAVEAMPDGGYLTVKSYHLCQMVVLEISDTGTGIPDGLNVFELFRTTKPDGTGLGLPLVRQIVSAHHGTINYTSVPGPGHRTTFKISLPAAE